MQNVLRFKPLHQAVGDEFVVVGRLQVFGHSLESHQKTIEIPVTVKLFNVPQRAGLTMPLAQFKQRRRIDRTLKMQMQLSLGKRNNKRTGLRRHSLIVD